ncbi:putative Na+/H+ antiporter [Streptomyces chrestomyceticus JCM 4735]|uniref:Na+/H+ antiporter n=1 Tax=Streptomyces chrestomyceticus JCM 4735 TaxID=1306181 RepID=A0A7U9PY03_9ACTN|nr:cation:proton antiporter [Streptomyces chrestomyceticus]GCD36907.1 putative Na+/H+ antiporter [Streptomyces chrestomyceticus JCM 4735]
MTVSAAPVVPFGGHDLFLFLLQVGLLLSLAFLLGRLALRLGMPAIVGELCAGLLLGPSVLAHVAPDLSGWLLPQSADRFHLLDAVGQIGVILLVGLTGLSMDLKLVRRRGGTSARISVAGLVVPLGLGVCTGLLVPAALVPGGTERSTFGLFMGVAMGVSAIPVIAKTLIELKLIHRDVGQLTLSAAMIDDIVGWMLLSVVSAMATTGVRAGDVAFSLAGLVVVIVAAVLLRPLVRRSLRSAVQSRERGAAIALVTMFVLLSAAGTQAMRLEAVFGAFVCGLLINSCGVLDATRLAPLRTVVMSVLAPLFFAMAGLRMDLTSLADGTVALTGLVVLTVAIAGKFAGAYMGARLSRVNHWESLAIGAGMNARGVIEVIVAMVGLRLGVLSLEMYTIIVLVAVVTSLMAPPLLRMTMAHVAYTDEERERERRNAVDEPAAAAETASPGN